MSAFGSNGNFGFTRQGRIGRHQFTDSRAYHVADVLKESQVLLLEVKLASGCLGNFDYGDDPSIPDHRNGQKKAIAGCGVVP